MAIKSKRNRQTDKTPWLGCLLPGLLLSLPLAQYWVDMRGYGSPALLRPLLMTALLLPGALALLRLIRRCPYEGRLWRPEALLVFLAAWILWGETERSILHVVFRSYRDGMWLSERSVFIIGRYMVSGGTVAVLGMAVCMLPLSYALSVCLYQMAQLAKRRMLWKRSLFRQWGFRLWRLLTAGRSVRRQTFVGIALSAAAAAVLTGALALAAGVEIYGSDGLGGIMPLLLFPGSAAALGLGAALALSFCRSGGLMSQVESLQKQIRRLYEEGAPEKDAEELLPPDSPLRASMEQLCHISDTLTESVRRAVAGERLKVELLANVSHDLKTPLTAIIGYGERLEKEELPPTAREYVERLNHKAAYLYDVVQDVFELSKISSGAVPVERKRLDVKKLWEQTIGGMDDEIGRSELTLRRRYEGQDFAIWGDGARLHRVFQNLLDNALKYSLPGSRIYLTVEGASAVRITLVNTASYEIRFDADTITERFVRGDVARTGEGSGLGLAIASAFTQACGGSLSVETDYDQFRVCLEFPAAD